MNPVVIGNATGKMTAIYALCEWPSGEPRYVGKTVQYIIDRRKSHIRASRNPRLPVHHWIKKRMDSGEGFLTKLIEHVPQSENWAERERHWIAKYRAEGASLLNLTAGGEGLPGRNLSRGHRMRIAAALMTGDLLKCKSCGADLYRKKSRLRPGANYFCTRQCANKYNRGGFNDA